MKSLGPKWLKNWLWNAEGSKNLTASRDMVANPQRSVNHEPRQHESPGKRHWRGASGAKTRNLAGVESNLRPTPSLLSPEMP